MTARILAVVAAVLLVGSVTLALSLPTELLLTDTASILDPHTLATMHDLLHAHAEWAWQWLALPLLQRPVWFCPAAVGLLCAGVAGSLANRGKALQSGGRN